MEFRPEGAPAQRAKLSWVAQDHGRLLFTGRRGQKVVDATPHGLALELRNRRLRILDAVPLLDRAMSHLSTRAKGPQADSQSPSN